jgi:hypothetical protein
MRNTYLSSVVSDFIELESEIFEGDILGQRSM